MTHPEAKDAARSARPTDDLTSPAAIERLRARDRRFVAAAITELERLTPRVTQLLEALQPHLGKALVIGFTGPPGAGKSTLVNALIRVLRAHDKTVGVIAVDPSSPVSGGAILGDRIRMTAALDDDGVFVRSLASRGYLGGLSPAAVRIIDALDAAGYDVIILETVGTGQNAIYPGTGGVDDGGRSNAFLSAAAAVAHHHSLHLVALQHDALVDDAILGIY